MRNIGNKIEKLISGGLSYNTLRGLSESQINLLYDRLVEEPVDLTKIDKLTVQVANLKKELSDAGQYMEKLGLGKEEMSEEDDTVTVVNKIDDGMGMFEMELDEKFESKAQQKFFWSKCENTKSPKAKKKWCKWAKEFSDKTPDFKKLPEKKDTKEIEEGLTKLVKKYIPESISKKQLMFMIEQASAPAKPKEKERTTTKPGVRPGKANPFTKPGPLPGPKAGDTQTAPTKPTTKPTTKPSTRPGKANPFTKPGPLPGPKAGKAPEWLSYNTFISLGFKLK
jgi:hypothetical protein